MSWEDELYDQMVKDTLERQARDPAGSCDMFKPPKKSVLVWCLHCGKKYQSAEMVFESRFGDPLKYWYCKFSDCYGKGYGFDIHTVETSQNGNSTKQLVAKRRVHPKVPAVEAAHHEK